MLKRPLIFNNVTAFIVMLVLSACLTYSTKAYAASASHPTVGSKASIGNDITIELIGKIQNIWNQDNPPRDPEINSPKSVNIHPSGKKFYINSLEGGTTVVYSLPDLKKIGSIRHQFTEADSALWAPASGLFKFRHYSKNLNTFMGKPVESAFSHNGRYLWVPYYRRSFDLNAQDPSAVAIIDTKTDKIVRLMEAGVLPKMIALSPDGKTIAISHWGDNTVGLIDVSSLKPEDWHYVANVVVGRQLFHNLSLTHSVNRDSNTGEALRGTVFTPDGKYLLVGCMSGGGIAVIDVAAKKYLGKLLGVKPNVRHLVIRNNRLYASANAPGYVESIPLSKVLSTIAVMDGSGNVSLSGWESCKVGSGARTLELSPKGDYIFVACNSASELCIVDSTMKVVGRLGADSFPVGLDVSPDGKWVITTSQGRKGAGGGNCVDVFSVKGLETDFAYSEPLDNIDDDMKESDTTTTDSQNGSLLSSSSILIIIGVIALIILIATVVFRRHKK